MTTIAASPLTDALQTLVDARLDTIDRMLLGRVNRQDRLAIVREVESQIFDLLQGRDGDTIDRDDVLAVLARLDPPEAYLADDDSITRSRPPRTPASSRAPLPTGQAQTSPLNLASGVLGMVAMGTVTLFMLFEVGLDLGKLGPYMMYGSVGLGLVTSLLAIIFAARGRLRGAWAISGLVNGLLAFVPSFIVAVILLIGN
jgi:hypothetical protein